MRNTSLKQIIEKHKQTLIKCAATGLIASMVTSFVACDDIFEFSTDSNTNPPVATETDIYGNPIQTEQTQPKYTPEHSNTYLRAKEKHKNNWALTGLETSNDNEFQMLPAPFRFLTEQGACYYEDGLYYAYGNEDFLNNNCISSKIFLDFKTSSYDVYMLVQYKNGSINPLSSNDGVYLTTWLLKYDLTKEVYRDLLLLNNDYRSAFLIQQIDDEFNPKIIEHSIVKYDLLRWLQLFGKAGYGVADIQNDSKKTNYISSVNYDDMSLTVNYGSTSDLGEIYSYTYKLKETDAWERVLEGNMFSGPMSQEDRDSLTVEDLMPTQNTMMGEGLSNFSIEGRWMCAPTDEQKSTSKLKYDFEFFNYESYNLPNKRVDSYDNGEISYSSVNNLTVDFENNNEKDLPK